MWVRFLFIIMILSGVILIVCDLPAPPPGPEKATVELGFELPGGEQVKKNSLTDTVGNKVKICMFLNLTQYFDSVVLRITSETDTEKYAFGTYTGSIDTATYPVIFSKAGNYTISLSGYVEGEARTVTGIITIIERTQAGHNNKPVLTVPKVVQVGAGQELMFSVYAIDPDADQLVTIGTLKKPESATYIAGRFKWTPTVADSDKKDTAIFIASDNGDPVESDTETVIIIVSATPVNLAPRWNSNEVKEFAIVGSTFEYELKNRCYDPESEKLTFTLLKGSPNVDTVVDTKYIITPSMSDTGKHKIYILARDPAGLEDILTLELTVSPKNKVVDKDPPVFTRLSNDSTTSTLSSCKVSVLCSDTQSGVDSVKCYLGTSSFDVTKTGDSLYTATVTGLSIGWNTITFIAKDASTAKNPCTLLVHIKYEKDPVDKKPPVITFMSPSKDTVIAADSFEVKVSCVDDSGCSVKGYRDGTTLSLKKSTSVANLWTGMAKGIAAGNYSTIKIVATDSSAAKNKDSLTIKIKYDNDKSGPVITLVNPPKDSITIGTTSYTMVVKCTDQSGVLSVNGTSGAAKLTGVRDTGSQWKITVSALENNKVTAVVLTATDSSINANKSSDTVFVKSYIENGRSVVFMKNDNAATGVMGSQTINSGDTAHLSLNTFVKDGSGFAGWAKTPTGAVVYTDGAKYVMGTVDDTLYAIWTKNSCTIIFDKNGGNVDAVPTTKAVLSGATVDALPAPPTRVGYTFSGWNTSSDGKGIAFTATTPVAANDTVFALWTSVSYTITYNLNEGTNSSNNPANYTIATPAIALASPTKTGFVFVGWFDNADLAGTAVNSIPTGSTGNKVFWAKWTTDGYTITYNLDGGTNNANNPPSYTVTSLLITLGAPTKTGFTFVGWYDNEGLTGTAVTSIPAGSTGAKVFWAKWITSTYTVDFNSKGGSAVASINNVVHGSTISKPTSDPTRAGYNFGGWYKEMGTTTAWNFTTDVVTGPTTLYAKWTTSTYTVDFNSKGGSAVASINNVVHGSTISKPIPDPTRAGFDFGGWYKETGTTTAWNFTTDVVTGPTTLYAKWTTSTYTVNFNSKGGSAVTSINNVPYGSTISKPLPDPTNTGYDFGGWYKETGTTNAWNFATDVVTGPTTLYAKWTTSTYTVDFNSKGGSAVASINNVPYGSSISKPLPNPTRTGYDFGGWYKETGTINAWNFTTDVVTGPTTLYAKWTLIQYTVSFVTNGGTAVASQTVNSGSTLSEPASARSGLTLVGWYREAGFVNLWNFSSTVTSAMTLYAKWQVQDYDGNVYDTIRIGTQTWMVQNLKTTRYNDGSPIPLVEDSAQWANRINEAFCWPNNWPSDGAAYGALYNNYVARNTKIAPAGWHVPTQEEFATLVSYVRTTYTSGENPTPALVKDGTNASKFTGLFAPYRLIGGFFQNETTSWYTKTYTEESGYVSYMFFKSGMSPMAVPGFGAGVPGYSIRCIKD